MNVAFGFNLEPVESLSIVKFAPNSVPSLVWLEVDCRSQDIACLGVCNGLDADLRPFADST
jgi:hypothetical protein